MNPRSTPPTAGAPPVEAPALAPPRSHHVEHDVSDAATLAAALPRLASGDGLAVDVETNQMHAYRGRLCFVQLATASDLFVVDTLAPGVEPAALGPALRDPRVRKVFHDAQGDLRVLAGAGLAVAGLFDTQRAATFLGLPKVGLGDLVAERFGVRLSKEHQTADFGARPVAPEIRAYVADDVRYLLPLAEALEAEARAADILEELALEFERICEEALEPPEPPRLKLPASARGPLPLAVAEVVDRIRQRLAAARDVPVGRVLPNAALAEIAGRLPRSKAELAKIPQVKPAVVREAGDELVAEIARLSELSSRGQLPAPPRTGGRPDPDRRDREARVKALRAEAAAKRKVTTAVVLPTYLLDELVAAPPADLEALGRVRWLGPKRLSLYGEALLAALRPR